MKINLNFDIEILDTEFSDLDKVRLEIRQNLQEFLLRSVNNAFQDINAHKKVEVNGDIRIKD